MYLGQDNLSRFFSSIPIKLDANFFCYYTQTHAPLNGVKTLSLLIHSKVRLNNPLKRLKNPLIHIDLAFIWNKTILNEKIKMQIGKDYY